MTLKKKEKKSTVKKTDKKKKKIEKIPYKTKEEIASDIISKFPEEKEKKEENIGPGRPERITATILQKLKVCFAVDMTNEEAAYFCGIGERTLQYYLEKNPEFLQEKAILKKSISLQAKFNIGRTIKKEESKDYGGTSNSWKRLEKKDPEFKGIGSPENPINLNLTSESQKLIDSLALE